jgi:regulator of sigma E protease
MEDDEAAESLEGTGDDYEVDPERTFDKKPLWARALVISAGVIMNLLFAFLVYTGLALGYGETLLPNTRVSVPPASELRGPARELAVVPDGATLTRVGGMPVKTWNDVSDQLGRAQAGPLELAFSDAPPVTLTLPPSEADRDSIFSNLQPYEEPVIGSVQGGTPAARAGLRAGDRVIQAAGQPVRTWAQLVSTIKSHPAQQLPLVVQRGGAQVAVTVVPNAEKGTDEKGNRVTVGKVGAAPDRPLIHRRVGPVEAVRVGAQQTWGSVTFIAGILKKLVTGEISPRNMGGIISIGEASGQTAQLGLEVWLTFLALFSVNLAVLNLLPIPILDGGHLMFLAFEAVRGRPLSVEARIRLSQVGLVIVVALMIWANGNDVVRLVFGR